MKILERADLNLLVTGLNHRTAPVAVREKIAFRPEDFPRAVGMLRRFTDIRESAIISTCNRTEIYAVINSLLTPDDASNGLLTRCLGEFHNVPPEKFSPHLYTKEGLEAARHLFSVTAGLDSLVIGENQILGQVKQSFKMGQELKSMGVLLHRLFQSAIEAGKRIRNETALGENPGSVGEAAVDLATQIFGGLENKSILIVGAGEMGRVVANALIESGIDQIMVCSRSLESAQSLAEDLKGTPFTFETLEHPLERADIVITAASSQEPVLRRGKLEEVMRERRQSPLFIIDIAVPRNVEESAGKVENLFLYNIDDLKQIVEDSNQSFQKEVSRAWKIVEEELERFHGWQQERQLIPTIQALLRRTDQIKEQELQKILSRLPNLGEKERKAFESLARSLVNKILHKPLVNLKTFAGRSSFSRNYVETARQLFGLDEEEEKEK